MIATTTVRQKSWKSKIKVRPSVLDICCRIADLVVLELVMASSSKVEPLTEETSKLNLTVADVAPSAEEKTVREFAGWDGESQAPTYEENETLTTCSKT